MHDPAIESEIIKAKWAEQFLPIELFVNEFDLVDKEKTNDKEAEEMV